MENENTLNLGTLNMYFTFLCIYFPVKSYYSYHMVNWLSVFSRLVLFRPKNWIEQLMDVKVQCLFKEAKEVKRDAKKNCSRGRSTLKEKKIQITHIVANARTRQWQQSHGYWALCLLLTSDQSSLQDFEAALHSYPSCEWHVMPTCPAGCPCPCSCLIFHQCFENTQYLWHHFLTSWFTILHYWRSVFLLIYSYLLKMLFKK